jgi:DNA repair protein RadD
MNGKRVSDGRIAHIYKDKFKCWPKGLDHKIMSPSSELTSFIKAKNIAYAKAMEANNND